MPRFTASSNSTIQRMPSSSASASSPGSATVAAGSGPTASGSLTGASAHSVSTRVPP